ncbi:MAG TPA: efflux RND transporter periplasmic adaptor subunit [Alphaproteobacteria bacterium]|nr:efflux RND transporter periplasmic adaptor subunit [Alphaproteobacteria bacterium]
MLKRFAIVLAGVVLVLGGFAVFHFVILPARLAEFLAPLPPVAISAAKAKAETWQSELSAVGTVKAINGVEIAPEVDGIVRRIAFESGTEVEAGELLVELDSAVEAAELKRNQALLVDAELRFKRGAELLKRGAFAQAELDSIDAARGAVRAEVERMEVLIAQKSIRTPFAGRLGIRQVDLGEYLSPGTPIVTLQTLDPIYVGFPLPERYLSRIAVAQPVEVEVDAYPERLFDGRIASIDARISQATRNVLIIATLANPEHLLLPGMFGNVRVLLPAQQDVVTVPETALTYTPYGDSVFVLSETAEKAPDGAPVMSATIRYVTVGERRADAAAILQGLEAGETVVTAGQIKLQSGASVVIDNSTELEPRPELPRE